MSAGGDAAGSERQVISLYDLDPVEQCPHLRVGGQGIVEGRRLEGPERDRAGGSGHGEAIAQREPPFVASARPVRDQDRQRTRVEAGADPGRDRARAGGTKRQHRVDRGVGRGAAGVELGDKALRRELRRLLLRQPPLPTEERHGETVQAFGAALPTSRGEHGTAQSRGRALPHLQRLAHAPEGTARARGQRRCQPQRLDALRLGQRQHPGRGGRRSEHAEHRARMPARAVQRRVPCRAEHQHGLATGDISL